MIRIYYKEQDSLKVSKKKELLSQLSREQCVWIDLYKPGQSTREQIEKKFGIHLFSRQEAEEIESSSKYAESEQQISINVNFLTKEDRHYDSSVVSLILHRGVLISQRNEQFTSFREVGEKVRRLKVFKANLVLLMLIESRVDLDADTIEEITADISRISRELPYHRGLTEPLLLRISELQEYTILVRGNVVEKQRIASSILKSNFFPKEHYDLLRIMLKDINSLLEHSTFNFERIAFLQNTFLGLVDIRQNRIIKLFTVVTVIFLPPTLIASVYGMNFKFMPELDEKWGYPASIMLMFITSGLTLLIFYKKKWL